MITFRLADALPAQVLSHLQEILPREADAARRQRIEAYLDAGHGACSLRDPRIGGLVEGSLLHFDGRRYRLLAWAVMPNHVHALVELIPGYPLPGIVHSWKSFTAKAANRILGRTGEFWQREYFDRYIRDAAHFEAARAYIHENPVKAGLVARAEDWAFSSARHTGLPSVETCG
jgi:REP element-mobilizing transposase RayT